MGSEADTPAPAVPPDDSPAASPAATTPAATPVGPPEPPWQRLHLASLFINLLPQAWRTLRGAWPLLIFFVVGGDETGMERVELGVLGVFFLMTLHRTVLHWLTLRYRIHQERLEIKSGLLSRRSRVIDPVRIQNMELVRNPLHRLSGLVELRIETAGDANTEGMLSALSTEEATALRATLRQLATRHQPVEADEEITEQPPLVSLSVAELLAYGVTQRTVGIVAVLTAVSMELIGRMGPEALRDAEWAMRPEVLGAVMMLAFCGAWLFSAGKALFKHFRYRMALERDKLVTEEGLTTRRRVEIPLAKVQLLATDEPFIRRAMGYGTLMIETAGLGVVEGEVRQAEGMVPMVERTQLMDVVRKAAPRLQTDPWTEKLEPAHPRALYRAGIGRLVRHTVFGVLLGAIFHPWGWLALVLIPLAAPMAYLDWRAQGWRITPRAIVARRGFFRRRTWIIDRTKLQSVHVAQGPLMRIHALGRLVVRVAGSEVHLPDLGLPHARSLLAELAPTEGVLPTPAGSAAGGPPTH